MHVQVDPCLCLNTDDVIARAFSTEATRLKQT